MTTKLHIWLRFSEVLNWVLLRIRSIYFIHVEDIKYLFRGTIFCSTSSFLCIHFSIFKDNSTFYMQSENIFKKICKILKFYIATPPPPPEKPTPNKQTNNQTNTKHTEFLYSLWGYKQ